MPWHWSVSRRGFLSVVSSITFTLLIAIIGVNDSQKVAGKTLLLQQGFLVASLMLVLACRSDLYD